jgi:hypothetical protein
MFIVNMNRPGFLPEYEGMECDTLRDAATMALDVIESHGNTTVLGDADYQIVNDIELGHPYSGTFPIEVRVNNWVVFIAKED